MSPALAGGFLTTAPPGKPLCVPLRVKPKPLSPRPARPRQLSRAGLQSQMLWGVLQGRTPGLGSLTWGPELSPLWVQLLGVLFFREESSEASFLAAFAEVGLLSFSAFLKFSAFVWKSPLLFIPSKISFHGYGFGFCGGCLGNKEVTGKSKGENKMVTRYLSKHGRNHLRRLIIKPSCRFGRPAQCV